MKIALVTGGSRGIGRAICLKMSEMDYHVLINYVSGEAAARETLDLINQKGGTGELMPFDVSRQESIEQALRHHFHGPAADKNVHGARLAFDGTINLNECQLACA